MLAVKSICLLPYLFKAFSRYSWIHFNLGSMHTCLLLLLSLALPKEKNQSESGVQHSSAHTHSPPLCLIFLGCQCCSQLTHEEDGLLYCKYPWFGNHPLTGSCGLYWGSYERGTDTEFDSHSSNSYLDC